MSITWLVLLTFLILQLRASAQVNTMGVGRDVKLLKDIFYSVAPTTFESKYVLR